MNSNRKRLGLYFVLLFLAITVTVTLRSIACIIGFDFETGYFTNKQLFGATLTTLLVSLFLLATYLIFGNPGKPKASFSTPATYIPTGVVCVALVYLLFELLSDLRNQADNQNARINIIITVLSIVLAVLSIGHFFLNAFITERASERRAYFSLGTICFLAFYAAKLYFDSSTPINAPNKITDQMAFLFAALFFLYEARISLGRERWRGYVSFGLIAALLSAYSSVPSLITYFVTGKTVSASVAESVTLLALCSFITLRLILVERLPEDKPSETVEKLRSFALMRQEEIRLSEKEAPESDEAQISIEELFTGDTQKNGDATEEGNAAISEGNAELDQKDTANTDEEDNAITQDTPEEILIETEKDEQTDEEDTSN